MEIHIDEDKLKGLTKEALVEVFEDRKEMIYAMVSEVIEDIALARAIKEGESTESIDKQEIISILTGQRSMLSSKQALPGT